MRVIETSLSEDLSLFSRYLWQQKVAHRIYEERGRQVVEVREATAADPVRRAYEAWRTGRLVLESRAGTGPEDDRLERYHALVRRFPVLIALLGGSILVFPFSVPLAEGELTGLAGWLTYVDLRSTAVGPGAMLAEPWRLVTPIFLHFSVVHLLFNLAVTLDFGRRIELGRGSARLALAVLLIGVASNTSQYLFAGNPLFGGLSGVAYGLLGFVLVSARRFPAEVAWQVNPAFAGSLLVFLLVFSTGITEPFGLYVANAAHWAGLAAGGLLALVMPPSRGAAAP